MNDNTLNAMIDHLIALSHLQEVGHATIQIPVDFVMKNTIEVIKMVDRINVATNDTIGDAEWYALLRDTRDLAAEVDAQVKALEQLNDALTLSA